MKKQLFILFRKYEGSPFVGMYRMFTPTLMIREPELIKNIVVKDFKHFLNNDIGVDKDVDRIFGRNPFALKGNDWKTKRAQLSPCFSSGKVKQTCYCFIKLQYECIFLSTD